MDSFLSSHWFPDAIILVVILLFALIKGHKGFFRCVVPVVILAIALVGSYFLTPYVEPVAQEKLLPFVQQKVMEKMEDVDLGTVGDISSLINKKDSTEKDAEKENADAKDQKSEISTADSGLVNSLINQLPDGIKAVVEKYGVDVEGTVKEKISDIKIGDGVKEQLTNSALALVSSAAEKAIHTGCYIVVALALLIVLNIIKAIINPFFSKAPVVSQVNKLAGTILGIIEALLIIYLVVSVMKLFNIGDIVTRAEGTYLLKLFLMVDPKGIVALVTKK